MKFGQRHREARGVRLRVSLTVMLGGIAAVGCTGDPGSRPVYTAPADAGPVADGAVLRSDSVTLDDVLVSTDDAQSPEDSEAATTDDTPSPPSDAPSEDAVSNDDGGPISSDTTGGETEPLAFTFALPSEVAPGATSAAPLDIDLDGDLDVVLGTVTGLRVLLNDGTGVFSLSKTDDGPMVPGGETVISGLLRQDNTVVVCTTGGHDALLSGSNEGATLTPLGWRAGRCLDVTSTHDGELVWLLEHDGVTGLYGSPDVATEPWAALAPPAPAPSAIPFTSAGISALWREQDGDRMALRVKYQASGDNLAVIDVGSPLDLIPDQIQLEYRADQPTAFQLRLQDANGAVGNGPQLTLQAGDWGPVAGVALNTWFSEEPALPIRLQIAVGAPEGTAEGSIWFDQITATREGHWADLVDDFDERAPIHSWPDAAGLTSGVLDNDSKSDLVVLRAQHPPMRLETLDASVDAVWNEIALDVSAADNWTAVLPVLAGPHPSLALVSSAGQDRLLRRNDATYQDVTVGSLPVDWADGRDAGVADLNGDGRRDIAIANHLVTDRLYLGQPDGRFVDVTPDFGFDTLASAVIVIMDANGDGHPDVVSLSANAASPVVRLQVVP